MNTLVYMKPAKDGGKITIDASMLNAWEDQNSFVDRTIQNAKARGRRVIVISHIPPGPGAGWNKAAHKALAAILDKHEDSIMAVLMGDTNENLMRSIGNTVSMVVAGISTRAPNNPIFREFAVDEDLNEISDMTTYYNVISPLLLVCVLNESCHFTGHPAIE